MPLFLIPFVILACGNTRMHKHQADAAMMEAQTHRAEYERTWRNLMPHTISVTSQRRKRRWCATEPVPPEPLFFSDSILNEWCSAGDPETREPELLPGGVYFSPLDTA